MIRRLRVRHRWMILVVALVCLAVYTIALLARAPVRRTAIPAALQPSVGAR
ncbi:MAG: hypothetical protein ABI587_16115 [Gemmatimonadales bacterium]